MRDANRVAFAAAASMLAIVAQPALGQAAEQRAVILNQVLLASSVASLNRRSDDTILRRDGQIKTLQAELKRQGGRNTALLRQLKALQDEQIAAIGRQSAERARAVAAFRKAIAGVFQAPSLQIQAALERYADGDAAALEEIAPALATAGNGPARLEADRGLAVLTTDALVNRKAAATSAVAAWKRVVTNDPDDYDAWGELTELYRSAGDAPAAADAAQRMERVAGAAQLRVQAIVQQGRAAESGNDLAGAARHYRDAVAVGEALVDRQAIDYQLAYPDAKTKAEADRARAYSNIWAYQFLRLPLTYLGMAEASLGEYPEALSSMQRAMELDMSAVASYRRFNSSKGSLDSGLLALATSADRLGLIALEANQPALAKSAYLRAIEAGTEEDPADGNVSSIIGLARALNLLGDHQAVRTALMNAEGGLAKFAPGTFKFGLEGEFWEQRGEIALAEGRVGEAMAHFRSAAEALRQAVPDDDASQRWAKALRRVGGRLKQATS